MDALLHSVSKMSIPHIVDDYNQFFTSKDEAIQVATVSATLLTLETFIFHNFLA